MSPNPAHHTVLDYLRGEPGVVRAADVLCDAATRLTLEQAAVADATAALAAQIAKAGVRSEDHAEIACSFVFLNHRNCQTSHGPEPLADHAHDAY